MSPKFETLILDENENIAWITLNRPSRLNALSDMMLSELSVVFDYLASTENRVIVISGAGRAFSAGYDIAPDSEEVGYAHTRHPVEDRNRQLSNIDLFMKIWRHPVPVITAVHGYCMAGATQLCVFSDITIVAEDAVIAASPAIPIGGGFISPFGEVIIFYESSMTIK